MDKFGVTAEDLKMRMKTMPEDLREYDLKIISAAFVEYRQNNSSIPTSDKMRKICNRLRAEQINKNGGWRPKKRYKQTVIRRDNGYEGDVIAEFPSGQHKSKMEIEIAYGTDTHIILTEE